MPLRVGWTKKNMKIKKINKINYNGNVYDLTIENNHNYYISNCLVHNCHEMSNKEGQHGDLKVLINKTRELPAGVELAIGGGNPLAHPELLPFLMLMKNRGIISNLTVNQGHLKRYYHLINYLIKENLVKGLGISITNNNFKFVTL